MGFSTQPGDRVDAAVSRLHRKKTEGGAFSAEDGTRADAPEVNLPIGERRGHERNGP